MTNEQLFIIVFNIFSGLLGYLIGRLNIVVVSAEKSNGRIKSFFDDPPKTQTIDIDTTKYVANIDINGLEKKYENFGDIKQSTDDISSSVDKLKNIKR